MTVLVAYATKHGSTREVAEAVADSIAAHGLSVDASRSRRRRVSTGTRPSVLGAALYMGHMHADAREFLSLNRDVLATLPVAVFAMGPFSLEEDQVRGSRKQLDAALARTPTREACRRRRSSAASSTPPSTISRSATCPRPTRATWTRFAPGRMTSRPSVSAGMPARDAAPTACGGGFESMSTAATSSTAIADRALAERDCGRRARGSRRRRARASAGRGSGGAAPRERDGDERELHEQHLPVARASRGRRAAAAARSLRYDPGRDHERDQHRREPREAQERLAPQLRRGRPHGHGERDEPADPERRRREVHPVGELGFHDEPASTALWPDSESPDANASESASAGQSSTAAPQPREVDERRDEREAERHRDERLAEARAARDRRQVAVEKLPERQLEHVLRSAGRSATMPSSSTPTTPIAASSVEALLDRAAARRAPRRQTGGSRARRSASASERK